ncbi:hypothetical protein [Azonexus sp.]|uniref:hypothetical protein n=1 Tax=Azonexus sp. TaxID=1872668 RepID=UPI0039E3F04A
MGSKAGGGTPKKRLKNTPRKKVEYFAGARFKDNQTQLFYVRNANDMEDARRMVIDEVGRENIRCLLIAERDHNDAYVAD